MQSLVQASALTNFFHFVEHRALVLSDGVTIVPTSAYKLIKFPLTICSVLGTTMAQQLNTPARLYNVLYTAEKNYRPISSTYPQDCAILFTQLNNVQNDIKIGLKFPYHKDAHSKSQLNKNLFYSFINP